jgi:hypothetical protein
LTTTFAGTQLREEVSLDKLRSWKAMRSRGGRTSTFMGGLTRFHEKMADVALKVAGEGADGEVSYQVRKWVLLNVFKVLD